MRPLREFTLYDGYVDKNGQTLSDEIFIKLVIDYNKLYDEGGNPLNYYYRKDNKYDLFKVTKQIRTKKFICEAPIDSGKSILKCKRCIYTIFFANNRQIENCISQYWIHIRNSLKLVFAYIIPFDRLFERSFVGSHCSTC